MCKSVSEKFPINMMLLGLFTASLAYTVSALCTFYDPLSILIAAGVAGFSTIGLTLYAFYSK
jgi:FtsH-binding integral membrane protein